MVMNQFDTRVSDQRSNRYTKKCYDRERGDGILYYESIHVPTSTSKR